MNKPGYADQDFWIRLIFMILFWAVLNIAISIFGIALLVLTIIRFGSQYEFPLLNSILVTTARFIGQIFDFLSFQTEEKPFPFQDWPESQQEEKDS